MDYLTEWITNIILFVLFATIIDMILPNSNMQKYTKMVTGLLLIAIILSPILKLLSNDFESLLSSIPEMELDEEHQIENSIDLQKKEIQASQDAYILEEMAVQLTKAAEEELMDQYGLKIEKLDFLTDENSQRDFPDNLQSVVVHLKDPKKEAEAVEVVKKVEIDTSEPLPSNEETADNREIASLLSEKWEIDKETIKIVLEGGTT
jgi:stage III sporulation protein AF